MAQLPARRLVEPGSVDAAAFLEAFFLPALRLAFFFAFFFAAFFFAMMLFLSDSEREDQRSDDTKLDSVSFENFTRIGTKWSTPSMNFLWRNPEGGQCAGAAGVVAVPKRDLREAPLTLL